jgi:hypothetical protein
MQKIIHRSITFPMAEQFDDVGITISGQQGHITTIPKGPGAIFT